MRTAAAKVQPAKPAGTSAKAAVKKPLDKKPVPKKAPAVPPILPREPLTKKAEAAINKYLAVRISGGPMWSAIAVKYVLQAERMRRSDLYRFLEERGYKWHPTIGFWAGPEGKP